MYTKGDTDTGVRCARCNKLLAEQATRPWRIRCARCGHTNRRDPLRTTEGQPRDKRETAGDAVTPPAKVNGEEYLQDTIVDSEPMMVLL